MVEGYTLTYGIDNNTHDVTLCADAVNALLTSLTACQLYTFTLRVNYAEGGINQIARDATEQKETLATCEMMMAVYT